MTGRVDLQGLADFGTSLISRLNTLLSELGDRLDTAAPVLTRADGVEVAQVIADAFATGTGILQADVTLDERAANLARVDPAGVRLQTAESPRVELEVAGRDLRPGDRLAGGQVADGAGLVVDRLLAPDAAAALVDGGERSYVLLLTDGRPFVIDPDRLFRIRRP